MSSERRVASPEAGVAHRAAGITCWFAGEYREAREHFERALALFFIERVFESADHGCVGEVEGAGSDRSAIGRNDEGDAGARRLGAEAADVVDRQRGRAGRLAAIDDDLVRRRVRTAERSVHRDHRARADIVGHGQGLERLARARRSEHDHAVGHAEVGDVRS